MTRRRGGSASTFLAEHDGLAESLAAGDNNPTRAGGILRDLKTKLDLFGYLTDPQLDLVGRLIEQIRNPVVELHVDAPEGAVRVEGTVVFSKIVETRYGATTKMLTKVDTPAGCWLAWSSAPKEFLRHSLSLQGCHVAYDATLTRGREPHFAFALRPRNAVLTVSGRPA